jgi:cell wall-associated NlpC family hydrolase
LASHRKPRPSTFRSAATGGAAGVTTAALVSVTLLSQSAQAAPDDKPSIGEVKQKVDRLYQQAGSQTQRYNAAKEKADAQRKKVDGLLDQVAARAQDVNDARRTLGHYATAQYRTGGMSGTATLLLTEDPQGFFHQKHVMERMTGRQQHAVDRYQEQQRKVAVKRAEAAGELKKLTEEQTKLRASKEDVQGKLSEARSLLSKLTAAEKKRLAEIERKKREEAERRARERAEREEERGPLPGGSYAAKAAKVIAFAEAQLGKPYVWGATGPNSYDCSGLTQDAWQEGGVSLPRTTWDQVNVGTKVSRDQLQPGDLVFFYDDISHVGLYVGGGRMIHAPKPGDIISYDPVDYMPWHSAVRPA